MPEASTSHAATDYAHAVISRTSTHESNVAWPQVNRTFQKLVEVGARVEAMAVGETEARHINSAFFTFVLECEARGGGGADAALPGRIDPRTPEEERRCVARLVNVNALCRVWGWVSEIVIPTLSAEDAWVGCPS
jgi:hypothetical protein